MTLDVCPFEESIGDRGINRQTLREQFRAELKEDISKLNTAQVERLDNLRDFIASGQFDVRVRNPEHEGSLLREIGQLF